MLRAVVAKFAVRIVAQVKLPPRRPRAIRGRPVGHEAAKKRNVARFEAQFHRARFFDCIRGKLVVIAVFGREASPVMMARKVLADVSMKTPRIPVVSNVDARPHDDPNEIRELLIKQVCSRVRWEDSMRYMLDEIKITQFYELGAGRVLAGLLKRIARKTPVENIAA